MPEKIRALKNKTVLHVHRNSAKYAAAATAAVFIKLQLRSGKNMNEFLEKHNLLDAFYNPVDEFGNEL